jgi:hypothetical protein
MTSWRCSPSPSTPRVITSPGLRKIGCGLMPMPTPGRGTRGDDVAGQQRHEAAEVRDDLGHTEDHLPRVPGLHPLAIHVEPHGQRLRVRHLVLRHQTGADGTPRLGVPVADPASRGRRARRTSGSPGQCRRRRGTSRGCGRRCPAVRAVPGPTGRSAAVSWPPVSLFEPGRGIGDPALGGVGRRSDPLPGQPDSAGDVDDVHFSAVIHGFDAKASRLNRTDTGGAERDGGATHPANLPPHIMC